MARVTGVAGRMGANAVRLIRRGVGYFSLPREGMWLRVRLAPPMEDLMPSLLFRRRDHVLSFLELLQVATNRHGRDAEGVGQFGNPNAPLALDAGHDLAPPVVHRVGVPDREQASDL